MRLASAVSCASRLRYASTAFMRLAAALRIDGARHNIA
jgi:hypothetical protein